ncbi:DUF1127 domain-containing protein [Actibacterium sp. D379-3]
MAANDTTRPLAGGRHAAGPLNRIFVGIISWNNARITRNALEKLSDHELDDIGLTRGDIDRIA